MDPSSPAACNDPRSKHDHSHELSHVRESASGGDEPPEFASAPAFCGARAGATFKTGPQGLGYYRDMPPQNAVAAAAAAPLLSPTQPPAEAPRPFAPGQRVRDREGSAGTVRYVGPVAASKKAGAVFVGVEWDDPGRGKHGGTVGGVAYFAAAHPTGGSLVKPSLLTRGRTFAEALAAAEHPPSTEVHAILKTMAVDRPGGDGPVPRRNFFVCAYPSLVCLGPSVTSTASLASPPPSPTRRARGSADGG